jgi:hypothetical protein
MLGKGDTPEAVFFTPKSRKENREWEQQVLFGFSQLNENW